MSDYSGIKEKAEALIESIGTLSRSRRERAFHEACTPQIVRGLIAENERLNTECKQLILLEHNGGTVEAATNLLAERDKLRAEVASLRTGYEAYERVNAELKAEVGVFRGLLGEMRAIGNHASAELTLRIDAAMGKGEQS
ncbi:hypothetical protein [Pseudomonas orientalis]|uniref:hypothetical protein n=1 Tax=Pseudomonas orientalis TaxID=76758 RepID=UPI000F5650DD|nr:hypothetical protein [Pseudomonas orientalis]AZE90239.1 hypothetical protein C4J97_3546 [Pseudomonas orientalis]